MKLIDLKKQTLQLMLVEDEEITNEDILNGNEDYSQYLNNFIGSFNGAISRGIITKIIPYKSFFITFDESNVKNKTIKTDTREKANDIYEIEQVFYIDERGKYKNTQFQLIGNYIILDGVKNVNCKYEVVYSPTIRIVEDDENNLELTDLGISNEFANAIKYYIKADLYEQDDATLAVNSRNIFENYISVHSQKGLKTVQTEIESEW